MGGKEEESMLHRLSDVVGWVCSVADLLGGGRIEFGNIELLRVRR
jgi:hypothetical protein